MSTTTNLSSNLAKYYEKKFMVWATGDPLINEWYDSKEYKELWAKAEKMLPPSGKYDRRTNAYKFMKYWEPRKRKEWERNRQNI